MNLDLINSWDKMPQFLIIQGPKNTGKTTLLLHLCKKFNLNYVKMKNGINDIRNLLDVMAKNSNTVYHFKDFDSASIRAKNALLKITEEPIEGNYIVVTGSTQIKTLESRAQKLVMNSYSQSEMVDYMSKYFTNFEFAKRLYCAGINTPSKVEKYHSYENLEPLLSLAYSVFDNITQITLDMCVELTSKFDSKSGEYDAVHLFLTMLIGIIENEILTKQLYSYYDILMVLVSAKNVLEKDATINRKFVLYRTMYSLFELRDII